MFCLPTPSPSVHSRSPPLAHHLPRPPGLCVVPREHGLKAQVGCLRGAPQRAETDQGGEKSPPYQVGAAWRNPLWPGAQQRTRTPRPGLNNGSARAA